MKITYYVILLLTINTAFAYEPPSTTNTKSFENMIAGIRADFISKADEVDKTIIKSVEIKVIDKDDDGNKKSQLGTNTPKSNIRSERNESGSYIIIPRDFLNSYILFCSGSSLDYSTTKGVERAIKFHHYLFERGYFLDKSRDNISMGDFLGIPPNYLQATIANGQDYAQVCFANGLIFLLAHEYGHHVLDKFYSTDLSKDKANEMEIEVDQWAMNLIGKIGLPPAGLMFIYTYERADNHPWFELGRKSSSNTHLSILERLKQGLCSENGMNISDNFFNEDSDRTRSEFGRNAVDMACQSINNELHSLDREYLEKLASQGDTDAYYRLGSLYQDGYSGTKKNNELSFENFKEAAYRGHVIAQASIARSYSKGIGTDKNAAKALIWYHMGEYQLDPVAKVNKSIILDWINEKKQGTEDDIRLYKCVSSKIESVLDQLRPSVSISCNEWCTHQMPGSNTACIRGICTPQAISTGQFRKMYSMYPDIYDRSYAECSSP